MLAYDCVPPVEAVSADAPQAIADSDADGILVLESVDREQVLADPLVFRQACKRLKTKPCTPVFSSVFPGSGRTYIRFLGDPRCQKHPIFRYLNRVDLHNVLRA